MREHGVWTLAWRRFRRDRLGFGCLIVVALYVAVMLCAALGWIARDWGEETAVSYAPPSFIAAEPSSSAGPGEDIAHRPVEDYGIPDPLGPDLAEIARTLSGASPDATRAATLPFGADKWGRDVLKKAVKGTQTSLFVGVAAALVATFLGTLFGAQASVLGLLGYTLGFVLGLLLIMGIFRSGRL